MFSAIMESYCMLFKLSIGLTLKTIFFEIKNIVVVLFFRTTKPSTLSKLIEAWQYANIVFICV